MKHYEANEGYTDKDKKKHKGKYKGDEMKIQVSLSQPDNPIKDWYIIKEYIKAGGKLEDVVDEKENKLTLLGALLCITAGVKFIKKIFK